MKAVRLVEIGHPLEEQQVSSPPVGPRDILVRIRAAGICHSDVHYRSGSSPVGVLPQTLGHEIAGVVEEIGSEVTDVAIGERVCLHYLLTCGDCHYCRTGHEQFCVRGKMLGKHCDGGYAEYIAVPARNAVSLPPEISFEHGAIMMCSSSTSFHALRKAELQPGETVAVFGAGGLGMSAIQLALVNGATEVYAVDISEGKLRLAETYGAIPVNASQGDPVAEIGRRTRGRGVDVAVELIGLRKTMEQAVQALAIFGRAVMVGIADEPLAIDSYQDLLCKEATITGSSDHLLWDLPILIEFARQGKLDLSQAVTDTIPLEASAINKTLDSLQQFGGAVRTVIVP
jgi:2-desacetyl-2-hydroxyethyl bacteriochlorophyllide A dehydrogenase